MTTNLRDAFLRRSIARDFVIERLGDDAARYDVKSLVVQLTDDYELGALQDIDGNEWAEVIAPHEYDANGLTDAALAKALKNSRTGWVVIIRRPGQDADTLNWNGAEDATPETIEALLREYMRLPEGTTMTVLPLIG